MTEKKIKNNSDMEKNGENENCPGDMCDNITNNNHSNILELKSEDNKEKIKVTNLSPKKSGRAIVDKSNAQSNGSPVFISVQEPHNEGLSVEKPRRRIRRTSDVIDSIGMNAENPPSPHMSHMTVTPRKFENRRASTGGLSSPSSDTGYASSVLSTPPSPSWVFKSPEESRRADTVDAAPMNQLNIHEDEPISLPTEEAVMPVDKYAEEYNMNHLRRGHAVIFNNDKFEMPNAPPREGSDVDVKNLQRMYTALGFEITVHDNKEYAEIRGIIADLAEADHSDADCLVITILSHGITSGHIYAKDVPYSVEYIWAPFTGDKCRTLAGKPKIFFIQACRGDKFDPGVRLIEHKKSRTQTDSSGSYYKIPTHADILIMYSSVEGFYSWRNPDVGTWFIKCLCEELLENASKYDLFKLLTRTSRRVALEHESYNDLVPWHHQQKQVPTITSMLIREVFFHPKK